MKKHFSFPLLYTLVTGILFAYIYHVKNISYGTFAFIQASCWAFAIIAAASFIYCYLRPSSLPEVSRPGWKLILIPLVPSAIIFAYCISSNAALDWRFFAPLILAISVGVGEELIFRKVVLSSLLKSTSPRSAILISAVLFSLFHIVNIFGGQSGASTVKQLLATFVAGLVYAVMYLYSRNIMWVIVAHAMWDYVGFTLTIAPDPTITQFVAIVPLLEIIAMFVIIFRHRELLSNQIVKK
ncbi:CPBP family intramembrane glutamic endopeptidase [Arcanobacterium canis]|uniref:CPBP family intramembrane metalloprotease n=1 Tax=Arcanobacterium canis TaxID=999183 RepID=A0ABY8FZX0_9ACTO|nr:CPBP family intramembrane glutamic endopeptidase [Arcanobacterium canis]WFM84003.1 CPBP family intramembrane metalloprotease [Arcanobacterium canis]